MDRPGRFRRATALVTVDIGAGEGEGNWPFSPWRKEGTPTPSSSDEEEEGIDLGSFWEDWERCSAESPWGGPGAGARELAPSPAGTQGCQSVTG